MYVGRRTGGVGTPGSELGFDVKKCLSDVVTAFLRNDLALAIFTYSLLSQAFLLACYELSTF